MIAKLATLLLLLAVPAFAQPIESSLRPLLNPKLAAQAPIGTGAAPALAGPPAPVGLASEATGLVPAGASGTVTSLALTRPKPRPPLPETAPANAASAALDAAPRPRLRPAALEAQVAGLRAQGAAPEAAANLDLTQTAASSAPANTGAKDSGAGPTSFSARPKDKPEQLTRASAAAPKGKGTEKPGKKSKETGSNKGSVCGVAAIKGEKIAPITSKVEGCGLEDGVRVTSISGVRLSMAATIDCATAKALNTWVERVAQPAYGGQIVELRIAGHYTCRPRNNRKGAKISEHGRGKAIDVAGFKLASGKTLPVLGGFDQTMRRAHKGACGIFGTTLGPGSDGFHEDHLHFDTASHRSGAYCR